VRVHGRTPWNVGCNEGRVWTRWRAGESISVISRQIAKPPGSVFTVLKHHGGIAPEPRKVRVGHLTTTEREEISRGLRAGDSLRSVAEMLQRPVSPISREVNRNGGREIYRATAAQQVRELSALLGHRAFSADFKPVAALCGGLPR